jgi:hypothetical protein
MKFGLKLSMLSSLFLGIAGCQSTPDVIEPTPFITNASYAYNIANQTYLTKNDSPLRDFSKQEIADFKAQLTKKSGGDVSVVIGAINILRLDLTGIISIAGGTAANIANSKHQAAQVQWLIAMDAMQYTDGLIAKNAAVDTINREAMALLKEKGNTLTKQVLVEKHKATFGAELPKETLYTINGNTYSFGMFERSSSVDSDPFLVGETNLINAKKQYVSTTTVKNAGVMSFVPFLENKVIGYSGAEGYEQYLLDLTSRLPDGFYLYVPSFPVDVKMTIKEGEDWTCKECRQWQQFRRSDVVVPAIYSQGKKYEFIKPE